MGMGDLVRQYIGTSIITTHNAVTDMHLTDVSTTSSTTGSYMTMKFDMPIGSRTVRKDFRISIDALQDLSYIHNIDHGRIKVKSGQKAIIELPDGSVVNVDKDGNFRVDDSDAKVIYKANRSREFNRYINASDLLEEFIRFLAKLGVKQSQVLNVPIELFINWIVIKSAEVDGDDIPDGITPIENHPKLPHRSVYKCLQCGKFIRKEYFECGFKFCHGLHAALFYETKLMVIS